MNSTLKTTLVLVFTVLLTMATYGQRKNKNEAKEIQFPFTANHWAPVTDNVEFTTYKSVNAVKSTNDRPFTVMLKDFEFTTGIIEYDVELQGQGFPGINFRVSKDTLNSEIFYLRYFGTLNPMSRNTMQYAALIDGINLWDLTDEYQAAATLREGAWNHIKLVVSKKQLKVYVNDMEKEALRVPAFEGITESGRISLYGNVIYANMVITPNATENLPEEEGYDPTYSDPRYLRNWKMTEPIDFPFGKDVLTGIQRNPGVAIDPAYLDSTAAWKPITAGHRAMVNLTKEIGGTKRGERRLTWLKTTVNSTNAQEKLMHLGFNDEVWVFINGQILYTDRNYYGSPGMKEPKGRAALGNTSIAIPFKEGENEILIGLTSYFFGSGLIARFENTNGLTF